jgi:hypothetical protein
VKTDYTEEQEMSRTILGQDVPEILP